MASEKQIKANRRNAAKSTGPKSAAGKQVVSMNALQHGLQAEHVLIPGEDAEEFEALLRGLKEHYQPVGSLELSLVERIARCTWRLQRAGVIESTIMRRERLQLESRRAERQMKDASRKLNCTLSVLEGNSHQDHSQDERVNPNPNLPEDKAKALFQDFQKELKIFNRAEEAHKRAEEELEGLSCAVDEVFRGSWFGLERISRYERTIERQFRNAMQDLERTQTARKAEAAESATVIDVTDLNEDES